MSVNKPELRPRHKPTMAMSQAASSTLVPASLELVKNALTASMTSSSSNNSKLEEVRHPETTIELLGRDSSSNNSSSKLQDKNKRLLATVMLYKKRCRPLSSK